MAQNIAIKKGLYSNPNTYSTETLKFMRKSSLLSSFGILFILLFLTERTSAYFEPSDPKKKLGVMNDISFETYKDFPQTWHLVTVRFREDSSEQRFVYANNIAWEAMKNFKPNYPDGSAFGKIGFITESDPSFPSSKVPSGARRFQLMVKNKKQYKSTDGWGYALFDSDGFLFDEDPKAKTVACAACHRIVPERDYVFSRPISLVAGNKQPLIPIGTAFSTIVKFETKKILNISRSFDKDIFKDIETINSLEGPLQKNAFSGTLDEVIPMLMQEAAKKNIVSMLFVNNSNYSAVLPLATNKKCTTREIRLRILVVFNAKKVRDAEVCY